MEKLENRNLEKFNSHKFHFRVKYRSKKFSEEPEKNERIENDTSLQLSNPVTKRNTIIPFRYLYSVTLTYGGHVAKLSRTNEINQPIIFSGIINPLISFIRDWSAVRGSNYVLLRIHLRRRSSIKIIFTQTLKIYNSSRLKIWTILLLYFSIRISSITN